VALGAVRLDGTGHGILCNCRIAGPVTVAGGHGNRLLACVIDGDVHLGGETLLSDCIIRGRVTVAADGCRLRHNRLEDCEIMPCAGTLLENNRLDALCLRGAQPGVRVCGNVIVAGITAEGCAGALIEDNDVGGGYCQRGGRDNMLRNNCVAGAVVADAAPWLRPLILDGNLLAAPAHANHALLLRNFYSYSSSPPPLIQNVIPPSPRGEGAGGEGARESAQRSSTQVLPSLAQRSGAGEGPGVGAENSHKAGGEGRRPTPHGRGILSNTPPLRDDHPALAYGFGPLDLALAGPRLTDILPEVDAWDTEPEPPAPALACRLEPDGADGYRLTIDNRGAVAAMGEVALGITPADAGELLDDDRYAYVLAPGEAVTYLGCLRPHADLLLETFPRGEGILPTALYCTSGECIETGD
jgi:hypothetical protein